MTIDKDKLKALAEAQEFKEWSIFFAGEAMRSKKKMFSLNGPSAVSCHENWGFTLEAAQFIAAANPATILALLEEIDRLTEEVALDDKIIAERDRLLDAIPQCAAHGQCVPYAIQWVRDAQAELAELREVNGNLKIENEALRKDAERYRFGVENGHWTDAQLDSAMAKEKDQ